jgi:hypothetical protein
MGLHNSLIHYIRDQLRPALRPRYIARTDERVFVEGPQREIVPDVLVKHDQAWAAERIALASPRE